MFLRFKYFFFFYILYKAVYLHIIYFTKAKKWVTN